MSIRKQQRAMRPIPISVRLKTAAGDRRSQAESFVFEAFRAAYGARVRHFFPLLMALRSETDALLAVLGLRLAGQEPLFLEQYLDIPAERALAMATGALVDRYGLVEVGNFAVGAAGGGRWLITALTAYLYSAGHSWAVFTCGPELQNAFRRLGIELVDLGLADPRRLSAEELANWGSYYVQHPRVMAASVNQSHAVLSPRFEQECALTLLWSRALAAGTLAA